MTLKLNSSATQSFLSGGTNDNALVLDATGIAQVGAINGGPLTGNRVINGAQEIDQVNAGAAVTPGAVTGYLTDMFVVSQNVASKLTFQQVADAPAGLKNSMKVTVAAQYAPAATDFFGLLTGIEGGNVIDFQFGTAGAATITTSEWIKGSVAGTYAVAIRNSAGNRSYIGTVSVTTSWAQIKITLTGDTGGTWLTDTGVGLQIFFDLGSGSNYNTTAGSWQAGNFLRTAGSVTFVNQTAGATLNITGVDCRLGSVAPTVFERRMNELQLCQRYFEKSYPQTVAVGAPSFNGGSYRGVSFGTADFYDGGKIKFSTAKRVSATMQVYSTVSGASSTIRDETASSELGATFIYTKVGDSSSTVECSSATMTANRFYAFHWTASARLF